MNSIYIRIAEELGVRDAQVEAAVRLLDEGATVPFIARYRKEVTGALDDTQLRTLEERLTYLRELEDRRQTVLRSIEEQGKLTDELRARILEADTKNRLEDLYLPFKPKRRTKGQIAREAGLEPLALALRDNPALDPGQEAAAYVNADKGVADVDAALEGARHILMESLAEQADLLELLRNWLWDEGILRVRVVPGKETEGAKFRDYFEHDEPLKGVPSHRALAIFRGRNEGVLTYSIGVPDEPEDRRTPHPAELKIIAWAGFRDQGRPGDAWLQEVVRWTWRVKLSSSLETDLMGRLRERAEEEAIKVFAANLKDLLLAPPAGPRAVIGLDPGLRTGVKVAVVDPTGKLVAHTAIFPHPPQNRFEEAVRVVAELCRAHKVELVSIGNGTASRETDRFVGEVIKRYPELGLTKVIVNEAGASVYSASELAAREFPDLDVTIRGAVSIARRLQDPLAELVKIDPKSIGVGQYQHDVSQVRLARALDAVVEDCVNAVGVDVNTASVPLLTRVSGLTAGIAENIVRWRDENGPFRDRKTLLKVPRLGEKTYEQAAGFLRIMNADNPLDASAVHPEAYGVVERIAEKTGRSIRSLIGDSAFLASLNPRDFVDDTFGELTVRDILRELDKPGRDPRPEFRVARLADGIESLSDLRPGMVLEGTVSNVTNFGAFVDIGVHQDGLVHISALSDRFVKDPREVVKAGQIVRVKVLEVDMARKRIALTMRLDDTPAPQDKRTDNRSEGRARQQPRKPAGPAPTGALAQALLNARRKKR